jgi:hypothetical protein
MKKKVNGKTVQYHLMWSPVYPYDKHEASRILPELPGIICILETKPRQVQNGIFFFSCWRDGLRVGLRNLFDPMFSKIPDFNDKIKNRILSYKYSVVETNMDDMDDIIFWLTSVYKPEFNNTQEFKDSGRYKFIQINELKRKNSDYIEKFPPYIR